MDRGPRPGTQFATDGDCPFILDQRRGRLQRASQVFPGLLVGIAFDGGDHQGGLARHRPPPGGSQQPLAATPHRLALTGQHVQDRDPAGRDQLNREIDPQQPGHVVDFFNQLALLPPPGAERPDRTESRQRLLIGERGVDDAVDPVVPGGCRIAEATNRQHDVGVVDRAVQQDRFAGRRCRQVGKLVSVAGIVG